MRKRKPRVPGPPSRLAGAGRPELQHLLRKVEEKEIGCVHAGGWAGETELAFVGDAGLVAGAELLTVKLKLAADHEDVAAASRSKRMRDGLPGAEQRRVDCGVLVHLDGVRGTFAAAGGHGDGKQLACAIFERVALLFPRRRQLRHGGEEPELHQLRRLGFGWVELRVAQARAGAHALDFSGRDDAGVAHRVAMLELPFDQIGDDFHLAMGMERESAAGGDGVVIKDPQGAKGDIGWVVVMVKGEVPIC